MPDNEHIVNAFFALINAGAESISEVLNSLSFFPGITQFDLLKVVRFLMPAIVGARADIAKSKKKS